MALFTLPLGRHSLRNAVGSVDVQLVKLESLARTVLKRAGSFTRSALYGRTDNGSNRTSWPLVTNHLFGWRPNTTSDLSRSRPLAPVRTPTRSSSRRRSQSLR